jgi:hypothetical protein
MARQQRGAASARRSARLRRNNVDLHPTQPQDAALDHTRPHKVHVCPAANANPPRPEPTQPHPNTQVPKHRHTGSALAGQQHAHTCSNNTFAGIHDCIRADFGHLQLQPEQELESMGACNPLPKYKVQHAGLLVRCLQRWCKAPGPHSRQHCSSQYRSCARRLRSVLRKEANDQQRHNAQE